MSMASNSQHGAVAGAAKSPTDKSFRPAAEDTAIVENERKKYKSIFMENPFVPVGLAATLGALGYGVYQLRTGNQAMSQKMMRLRVGAQAFTVLALLVGAEYASRTFSGNDEKSNSS